MKDWLEAVYCTVRYYVDPRFRKQVKVYRELIERSMLSVAPVSFPEYALEDDVWYDDDHGVVKDFLETYRSGGSWDYLVKWDNGHISWVWGSDLMNSAERAAFDAE